MTDSNTPAYELRDYEVACQQCHLTHHKGLSYCPNCNPDRNALAFTGKARRND